MNIFSLEHIIILLDHLKIVFLDIQKLTEQRSLKKGYRNLAVLSNKRGQVFLRLNSFRNIKQMFFSYKLNLITIYRKNFFIFIPEWRRN
jgi:hypothetical protein